MDDNLIKEVFEEKKLDLKRGQVLSVKHSSIFEPVLTVIQKIEGRNVFFRVPDEFLKSVVLKGDQITCHLFMDDYEYVFSGFISDIDIHYPFFVQVYVDKFQKYSNKRKSKRFMVNFPAYIMPVNSDKSIYAIIKNISLTGLGAVFKEHINIDSTVVLKVLAQIGKKEMLTFKAKIIRATPKNNYSDYGLQITEIDEKNKDMLDRLIYKLQENESTFISESLK